MRAARVRNTADEIVLAWAARERGGSPRARRRVPATIDDSTRNPRTDGYRTLRFFAGLLGRSPLALT